MKKLRIKTSHLSERRLVGDLNTVPYYINTHLWGCLHPYHTVGNVRRKGYDGRPVEPPERSRT
jgi:hypothetical protein